MKELPLGKSPAEKVITTLHTKDEEKLTNLFMQLPWTCLPGKAIYRLHVAAEDEHKEES